MKKYILILEVLVLLFYGCENNKTKKQEKENLNNVQTKTDSLTVSQAAQKQDAVSQLTQEKKSKIKVTFIELGSVRCIPCKMMMPIMKEIEEKYKDEVKVIFYDVWTQEGKPYAEKYQIHAIPTQVFLDENGKEYFRHVGFFPREELFEVLKKKGVNIK